MNEPRYKGIKLSELQNPQVITRQQTNLVLSCVLNEKGSRRWWRTKIDKLDGFTPDQVWKTDKKRVYELALSYLDTSYS